MNIFFLSPDLAENARFHVNKHAGKMILEAAQLLTTCYPKGEAPYRQTHFGHCTAVWVRKSLENFNFTINYAKALGDEFHFRYNKRHKSEAVIDWFAANVPKNIPSLGFTDPPRAFSEFKDLIPTTSCIYQDYRNYYRLAKRHLFVWKNREIPEWTQNDLTDMETIALNKFAESLKVKRNELIEKYSKLSKKESFSGWGYLSKIKNIEEQLDRLDVDYN